MEKRIKHISHSDQLFYKKNVIPLLQCSATDSQICIQVLDFLRAEARLTDLKMRTTKRARGHFFDGEPDGFGRLYVTRPFGLLASIANNSAGAL
jgi:hypothetical protein